MKNKVSIIIPVYNGEKYLKNLLNSILNQTYKNIEIIIINDGSIDNSLNLLKEYEKKYNFIKIINQKNKGRSESRNIGVKKSTGEYITFVDQDDYLSIDFIEILMKNIMNNDIILSGFNRVSNNKVVKSNIPKNCNWSYYKYCATWGKLYKKSFFSENNLKFHEINGEDIYLFLNAISLTDKKVIVNYAGYNNYINLDSITHTINSDKKTRSKIINLLNKIEESEWCKYLDQSYLLDFYLKTIILHLFNQRKILNYKELCKEFEFYYKWLKKVYKTRNRKIKFFKQKGEEFYVIVSLNLFIILMKMHLIKPFLFFFRFLSSKMLKN